MNARILWCIVALSLSSVAASCSGCRGNQAAGGDRSITDLQKAVRTIAPPNSPTTASREEDLKIVLLAVQPEDLSRFKFDLEYDLDDKDIVEYVFHDIDNDDRQRAVMEHFQKAPARGGIKVLTDVDDTMYANLVDKRYGQVRDENGAKPLYPGVLAFYSAVKHEPFEWEGALDKITGVAKVPLTTLSARPNPFVGELEKASIEKLSGLPSPPGARLRLMPSALSGAIVSSTMGTGETFVRAAIQTRLPEGLRPLDVLHDHVPDGQERKIGEVKFRNFQEFARVYPEYRYVFVGDSGQADALTAKSLVTDTSAPGTSRVVTTFIHALKAGDNVTKLQSEAFRELERGADVRVNEKSASGRGVIVFRNYIDAAVIAYAQRETLRDPVTKEELITAQELATIAESALVDFAAQTAGIAPNALPLLREEYKKDAERAAVLLAADPALSTAAERIRAASSKL